MLLSSALIVAVALQSRVLSLILQEYGVQTAQFYDAVAVVIALAIWLVLHAWLVHGYVRNSFPGRIFGQGVIRDENIQKTRRREKVRRASQGWV